MCLMVVRSTIIHSLCASFFPLLALSQADCCLFPHNKYCQSLWVLVPSPDVCVCFFSFAFIFDQTALTQTDDQDLLAIGDTLASHTRNFFTRVLGLRRRVVTKPSPKKVGLCGFVQMAVTNEGFLALMATLWCHTHNGKSHKQDMTTRCVPTCLGYNGLIGSPVVCLGMILDRHLFVYFLLWLSYFGLEGIVLES